MAPFTPQSFLEENIITQILEKHKLDGSSGGDIKVCLDILLNMTDKEEIDKLLLDLECFSQKMESTLREPSLKLSEPAHLQVFDWQGRQTVPLSLEPKSELKSKPVDPPNPLSKAVETNGHKMEDDDKALLLRILESIEDFAQELVEFQTGKGSLSKEKEVMRILQETLTPPSQSLLLRQKSCVGATPKDSVPAAIEQAPEVIKVRPSILWNT
uniref:Uncharacterized protein n=1 Tax=Nothoprocta perdicaria TaxID=30464 RepID=A0A8C7A637_NOTPE